jgi:hypothetical protein
MPLLATLAFNFVLGAAAARAAARELRASPRAVLYARAFRAVALHEALVAMPVATFVLVRFPDWTLSYTVDGAKVPSAIVLGLVALHGALALGGFALGAGLLREHRARWIPLLAGGGLALVLLGALAAHARLAVMATYLQYRSGFGARPIWHTSALGTLTALALVWAAGAAHLLWSLARTTALTR